MKVQQYIDCALIVIDALKSNTKTIAAARAHWEKVVCIDEPCFTLPKKLRTKAQIVAKLQFFIDWLNDFGRVKTIDGAHAEALAEWFDRLDSDLSPEGKAAEALQTDFYAANDEAARRVIVENCHDEALEMNARHFPVVPEAVALVDYLTAAIADGAGSLGGYVLRKGDKYYCVGDRSFTNNPLRASYFDDKEEHLMPQFMNLYGMTALRLGDAVRAALSAAKADCEDLASQIATLDEVYDATATPAGPRRSKGHALTEMHRCDRRYAVASYGRMYAFQYRTDRYHTLTA